MIKLDDSVLFLIVITITLGTIAFFEECEIRSSKKNLSLKQQQCLIPMRDMRILDIVCGDKTIVKGKEPYFDECWQILCLEEDIHYRCDHSRNICYAGGVDKYYGSFQIVRELPGQDQEIRSAPVCN